VLLGISTLNVIGMTGAVYQMVAHGLVAGITFMLIGLLYERTHTKDINDYGSLIGVTPRLAFFTILALIAGVGLPGTAGFVAELHVMIGGFQHWSWIMLILSFGIIVSAAYNMRTVKRLFTGPTKKSMQGIPDLRPTELIAASVLMMGILLLGIYPSLVLDVISPAVNDFILQITLATDVASVDAPANVPVNALIVSGGIDN
ncbi:MAG: proton-conducting transporter membrane subunit, partial [Methylophagaceae bacterium]